MASNKFVIISIFLITLLGIATKLYSGPFSDWINSYLGGIFYVIFWCLLLLLFFPKFKTIHIIAIVFIFTCIIEFSQLWHPPFLETLRSNLLGKTILGTTFSLMDFPFYVLGAIFASIWINILKKYV